jgi:hypothetical protein
MTDERTGRRYRGMRKWQQKTGYLYSKERRHEGDLPRVSAQVGYWAQEE